MRLRIQGVKRYRALEIPARLREVTVVERVEERQRPENAVVGVKALRGFLERVRGLDLVYLGLEHTDDAGGDPVLKLEDLVVDAIELLSQMVRLLVASISSVEMRNRDAWRLTLPCKM